MLHIVNGDSVGEKLKHIGIEGDILVWREVYTAGPVFTKMTEERSRSARAEFMTQAFGVPMIEYVSLSEAQERTLREAGRHDEIVLWFEYDLFDQTILSQLLHALSMQELGNTKLSVLNVDSFPGITDFRGLCQLTVEQLRTLVGTWQPIGRAELEYGREIWERYTSPNLEDHIPLLRRESASLFCMRAAMEFHLSRLPSVHNGLGGIEQATLEAVATGTHHPYELFSNVGNRLHMLGMGDLEYWYRLKKMAQQPNPLLHSDGAVGYPDFQQHPPQFRTSRFTLTELGRRTLAGEADWAETGVIDEWIGGCRISNATPWRWDPSLREVVYLRH